MDSCCLSRETSSTHKQLLSVSCWPFPCLLVKCQSLEKPAAASTSRRWHKGNSNKMEQWQRNNTSDASLGLTWTILFGENPLYSARAMVDHATTSIHFARPSRPSVPQRFLNQKRSILKATLILVSPVYYHLIFHPDLLRNLHMPVSSSNNHLKHTTQEISTCLMENALLFDFLLKVQLQKEQLAAL